MLPERKNTILRSLIQEYVISAYPVASSTLVRYYVPRLSAATVRNELNWLEHRGYVVAPHTSAGRMPTTTGYRTFVNNLLLHPYSSALRQRDGAGGSVGTVRSASLATIATASDKLAMIPEILAFFAEQNKGLMVFWAPQLSNAIIHRGLPILLSQPEFAETSAALPIMQLLESHGELMAIFKDILSTDCLHIKIGSEHKDSQLYEFSLVAQRFDCAHLTTSTSNKTPSIKPDANYGVVALFGPTRMNYEWAISSISSLVKNLESSAHYQRN
ncbi:MAG: hypothetical protein LBP91_01795 [Coriobacteriales bacterium]|nr:hypothetical protein [Coriobacteriales bacterium]